MVIDPRRKRFLMNVQLRQCFARAKLIRLKISQKKSDFSGCFISKKAKGVQKSHNFTIWLQKSQIGNPATQELRMRIKYARKLAIFCYVWMSRKLNFPFPLLRHYEMSECFYMLKTAVFSSCNSSIMLQKLVICSQYGQRLR